MKLELLTTAEDCQWLRETHLKGFTLPSFASFMLRGNEDCPESVGLYKSAEPTIRDEYVAHFAADIEGNLQPDKQLKTRHP